MQYHRHFVFFRRIEINELGKREANFDFYFPLKTVINEKVLYLDLKKCFITKQGRTQTKSIYVVVAFFLL